MKAQQTSFQQYRRYPVGAQHFFFILHSILLGLLGCTIGVRLVGGCVVALFVSAVAVVRDVVVVDSHIPMPQSNQDISHGFPGPASDVAFRSVVDISVDDVVAHSVPHESFSDTHLTLPTKSIG